MGILSKNRKQRVKTEEIHDGYCIVSFKKSFIDFLKKDFKKQADNDYNSMQRSLKENNGIPVIPANYNANNVKYRMQIESAIYNEGIVGFQITDTDTYTFDDNDYSLIENKLFNSNLEFLPFNNDDEKIFICPNDKNNIEKISDIVYSEVINKRENCGIGIVRKDGFLNKDLSFEEQQFVEKIALEMLSEGNYLGDQQLALNLLLENSYLTKIILQEKHKKDVEKILIFLSINHILMNNAIIVSKKDLKDINENIDNYIHGAIIVKDKQIYGLETRKEVSRQIDEPEKSKADIDQLIEKVKNKQKDNISYNRDNEIIK